MVNIVSFRWPTGVLAKLPQMTQKGHAYAKTRRCPLNAPKNARSTLCGQTLVVWREVTSVEINFLEHFPGTRDATITGTRWPLPGMPARMRNIVLCRQTLPILATLVGEPRNIWRWLLTIELNVLQLSFVYRFSWVG